MSGLEQWWLGRLELWLLVLPCLAVHEAAHAFVAQLLGDRTARDLGRVSLDPLVHLDPVGSVLLPLLGVPFGWAKPVPIRPERFDRRWTMSGGTCLVAAAGPASNLALAGLAWAATRIAPAGGAFAHMFGMLVVINLALALFNLVPIHPLDGSRIVEAFLPRRRRRAWDRFASLGPWLLLGLVVLLVSLGRRYSGSLDL